MYSIAQKIKIFERKHKRDDRLIFNQRAVSDALHSAVLSYFLSSDYYYSMLVQYMLLQCQYPLGQALI